MIGGTIVTMAAETATTFADPAREADFRRDGYAVMPVLAPDQVAEVLDFYWSEVAQPGDFGLCIDHMRDDRGPMRRIAEHLGPLWERVVPHLFRDHRAVFCTFVVKHPGVESQMGLHEDQSWVDETRFRSGTMWVPLTDVGPTTRNGALGVVPGSQRLGVAPCGAGTPFLTAPFERSLGARVVVPTMSAGTGLFYDSRTLHGSGPNESDEPRVALACGIVPKGADLRYVRAQGRRRRTVFAVDDRFYLDHSPRQLVAAMPDGYEVVDTYTEDVDLTPEVVGELLGTDGPVAADPVVPWSVHPSPDPAHLLGVGTGGRCVDHDLEVGPPDGPLVLPGWTVQVDAGHVGRAAAGLRDQLAAELGVDAGATAVVVGPWSRCTFLPSDGAVPLRLEVVDCGRVAAGVAQGGAAANVGPGDVVDMGTDGPSQVWNEGPFPLIVLVGVRPRPQRRGLRGRFRRAERV